MDSSIRKSGYGVAIAALVLGLLIGFGITKAMDRNKMNNSSTPSSATKAADLRSTLVTLGVEHMTYTDQAIDAALDNSPNASASAAALYANGNDIGAEIGSVYGTSAQTTFDKVWKLHLDDFVKYAEADSQGNTAGETAALNDIEANYTKPLAQFLAKANPNLPEATLESALGEHVEMTAQMINDHVQGKYTDEANELTMANQHIEGLMSTLAAGIVKQYPSKF
jgi:hypothetical protein